MTYRPLYDPFSAMQVQRDACFLCGQGLSGAGTAEHVFPKWLQRRYELWNQKIKLLNGTAIPYRQMVVPCCSDCNGGALSVLEKELEAAVKRGFDAFIQLDELHVFQWISKIFYGLLYKELTLQVDRATGSVETIVNPQMLERYRLGHTFLQSVRLPMEFRSRHPWSLFRFRLHPASQSNMRFYYRDSLRALTFAMLMDDIGVILCLQDNGEASYLHSDLVAERGDKPLHPLQFLETIALVTYSTARLNRVPLYTIFPADAPGGATAVYSLPTDMGGGQIYGPWEEKTYATILARLWGRPLEDVLLPDGVITLLRDSQGRPLFLPPDA